MFFFSSWYDMFRIFVTATLSYVGVVFLLRISGNRTLSKMNSFDLIVTIALGSTLASGILQKSLALSDILLALASLIAFQYIVTWLSVRSSVVESLVKSEPALVFRSGRFLAGAMKRARVTREEILSAIRQQGFARVDDVDAVVLESNGQLIAIGPIADQDRKQEGDPDRAREPSEALVPSPIS